MKYRTFRRLLSAAFLTPLMGVLVWLAISPPHWGAPPPAPLPVPAMPPPAPQSVPEPPPKATLTTAQVRDILETFLAEHGDHDTRKSWEDCIPDVPFHATAIRFSDTDHQRWFKNDPKKWSQIRLTQFADGRPDEKWLLRDGHTYKREVLDSSGKVTETQRF